MKKSLFVLGALALPVINAFAPTAHAQILLTISEVYGAGGNASATYSNDFIELFNAGTTPIPLGGYSVQYTSNTGTTWAVTSLPISTINPGQYFLVQEGTNNAAVGAALPTPGASGTINLAAGAGKVALVNTTTALTGSGGPNPNANTAIIDFVGYGNADVFEGTAAAAGPSNTITSIQRLNGGATDTNQNSTDFTRLAPTPVPEPSTYVMMASAFGLLLLGQRVRSTARA